jgi:8-oxo-dGTP diphosphatase
VPELYLVRHAKAGERRLWTTDDLDRPLSRKGWKQSDALAKRLAKANPPALISSPYVRCIQTLEPLAERLGQPVQIDERLTEDEPVEPMLDLFGEVPDGSVLCTHGDLIEAAIERLCTSGTKLGSPTDWRKASVWVLQRGKHGKIVKAKVWPPPAV